MTTPTIDLCGTGPGDPALLTRRAARLLAEAEVVVADRHSADPIVALAPVGAEVHRVGRTAESPAWELDAIVTLLEDRARAGRRVLRLKSGDPFVCSRGAEELEALAARGIACRVTPGVSAFTAAPLAAGSPLGRWVAVASGDDDPRSIPVPWTQVGAPAGTLVVLIGRTHQRPIANQLIVAGRSPHTGVDLVHGAGRPGTLTLRTTLGDLGSTRLPPTATFIVHPDGEV